MLLNHDPVTRRISFRHYNIAATPSGVTKSVKSLIGQRHLPDMAALNDVSELLTKSGYGSVSGRSGFGVSSRVVLLLMAGRDLYPMYVYVYFGM